MENIEKYRKYLSVDNTLKYALENVPFYRENKDAYDINKFNEKDLDSILLKLPVIDQSIFNNYKDLISDTGGGILFLTSGSTGKPKVIPKSHDSIRDQSFAFYDVQHNIENNYDIFGYYKNSLGKLLSRFDIFISGLPPKPAVSGTIVSKYLEMLNSVEINKGPNSKILDLLLEAYPISNNRSVSLAAFPPSLLKEVYNSNDDEINHVKDLISKMNVYIGVGGDYVSPSRASLIKKLLGAPSGLSITYASTEGLMGVGPNDEIIRLSGYNNHYLLRINNQLHKIDKTMIGKEGELILTTKVSSDGIYSPLINYNSMDIVKILDIVDYDLLIQYIGRSDNVVHFGSAAKLSGYLLDDVLSSLILKYNIGEGFFKLTQENGLDKLTLYTSKENFNGSKEDLVKSLKEQLSKREPELAYVLNEGLGYLGVEFVDRNDIPSYQPNKYKNKILIDERLK